MRFPITAESDKRHAHSKTILNNNCEQSRLLFSHSPLLRLYLCYSTPAHSHKDCIVALIRLCGSQLAGRMACNSIFWSLKHIHVPFRHRLIMWKHLFETYWLFPTFNRDTFYESLIQLHCFDCQPVKSSRPLFNSRVYVTSGRSKSEN